MREPFFRTRSRKTIDAENREELDAWIAERVDELIALGLDPAAARVRALAEFGDRHAALAYADRQDVAADRRVRAALWLEEFVSDLKIAARTARRLPWVTAVVLVTLALGVGATTAVFSVAQALLLRPLPYGGEDTLAYLPATDDGVVRPGLGGGRHSAIAMVTLRERTTSFSGIAGVTTGNGVLRGEGDPEQVWAAHVTTNALDVLQAPAALGRTFRSDDETRDVVILTDAFWRRHFNADPAVVGRTIDYGRARREVIGVMPAGFRVPTYEETELLMPQRLAGILSGANNRTVRFLRLFGRLKAGVSEDEAQRDLEQAMRTVRSGSPGLFDRVDTRVLPIRAGVAGNARQRLLLLLGAAAFVLLIACANVAGVLLSRGVARQSELAVRVALGAARPRLIRQFLAEGALLACLGAVLGLVVATLGIAFLRQIATPSLPVGTEFALEPRVVSFGVVAAVTTAFLATMLPAVASTRQIGSVLRREGGRATSSRVTRGIRLALVTAQLTVAVVLLVGAGLLLRTMHGLTVLDLGYATDHALTFRPQFSRPMSNAEQDVFYEALYTRLRAIPGVVSVGGGNIPTSGLSSVGGLAIEGRDGRAQSVDVRYTPASDDYFKALRIPVLRGRVFRPDDRAASPRVAVISAGLADQMWPRGDAIGSRVRVVPTAPWATIVGIVGDVRMGGGDVLQHSVYTSQRQDYWPAPSGIVVRTAGDPAASIAAAREAVRQVDPSVVVPSVRTLDDVRQGAPAVADRSVQMQLLVVFAVIALAVSAIGVYGVSAYAIEARQMEFGIRVALGASRKSVMWLAIRDSAVVAVLGVCVGIPLAWLLARRLREVLFAVQPFDLATMAVVVVVLVTVVFAAVILPARRAALVDPVQAIRAD